MSEAKDTIYRQLTLLKLIPRYPGSVSTSDLIERLKDHGFKVTQRTLQRDLGNRLSVLFPLLCDESEKPFRWSFRPEIHLDLPSMDATTALTFYLAEQQLSGQLPLAVVNQLRPQFDHARKVLEQLHHNNLTHWVKNVRAIPNGKTLIPAPIEQPIWQEVTTALLEQRCLQVEYLSRATETLKSFCLHIHGLVTRYSSSYLVARVDGYDDLRQFALHRIQQAKVEETQAAIDPDFDIDQYISKGAFAGASEDTLITLVADIHPHIAWLLNETPLSKEQQITALGGDTDWKRLTARVQKDQETLWWIHGLNANIRVHEPVEWVEQIKGNLSALQQLYS
jgi:predicted DNA-binding transcriptional regulator YafY